jgi:hypothetical protein
VCAVKAIYMPAIVIYLPATEHYFDDDEIKNYTIKDRILEN